LHITVVLFSKACDKFPKSYLGFWILRSLPTIQPDFATPRLAANSIQLEEIARHTRAQGNKFVARKEIYTVRHSEPFVKGSSHKQQNRPQLRSACFRLPAIRSSVPDILRQPLRRTSSLRYLVTSESYFGHWESQKSWILDLGASLSENCGRSPLPFPPSHQQARWARNHSLGVTTLRSATFSRLHTRTRSEWWPWSWHPSSFCSLVLVCPAPALALLKNLPSRFGPHRGMCCALYPFHYSSPLHPCP
jgi:hypothetical protein